MTMTKMKTMTKTMRATNNNWWTVVTSDADQSRHVLPTIEVGLFPTEEAAQEMKRMLESRDDVLHFASEDDEDGDIRFVSIGHTLDSKCPCQPVQRGDALVHNMIQ
jgi:hypothetical protein